ncbi:MAG: hypothetical protein ACFFE7_05760 [Candidatus Thorarchaeota archaeon]
MAEIDACQIRFTYTKGAGSPNTLYVDASYLNVVQAAPDDYELDLEIGWTAADFDETNEYLCVFAGTQATEALMVDVWDGVGWTNVIAALTASTWNNVSVSAYLSSSSFEIRFVDSDQANDGTQNTWDIDAVLLHTWTPSYTPAIDQAPTLDNPTDTDNMYAQYQEYQVTIYVSDQNGFIDIDYLEVGIWDNTQTTEYCRFRYDEDTNTFSKEYDIGTTVSLNTGSSTAIESGNDINATFYFTVDWDFPDSTDLDAQCYVIDTQTESATSWYEVNWDIETRLDYLVTPSVNDASGTADRGNLDGSFSLTGTIIYYTSVDDFPASTAVDVWVSASEYGTAVGPWNDLTLTSGAFDVTCYADDAVGLDTYTVKVVEEGTGSGGTDLYYTTSVTDSYIADRLVVSITDPSDQRINIGENATGIVVSAVYDYDSSAFDGTLILNDTTYLYGTVGKRGYTVSSALGGAHSVSLIGINDATFCVWDSLTISLTDPADQRVDVSTNATGIVVSAVYDYDGTIFDGTLTLNNTQFTYVTAQRQDYTVQSVSGGTHGITAISVNDVTFCIWDSLTISITDPADQRQNINVNASGIVVSAVYDYDGSSFDGTLTLNNTQFTYTTAQKQDYTVQSVTGGAHGITAISTNDVTWFIWDSLTVTIGAPFDQRININSNATGILVSAVYDYDGSVFDGTLTLNNTQFTYVTAQRQDYTVQSVSGGTHGITAISINDVTFCIWDSLTLTITDPADQHININTNASGVVVSAVYDYDGTPFDGILTLNNTQFTYATPQIQWYSLQSVSGGTHGITALSNSDNTWCIWDSLTITITDPADQRININTNASGIVATAVYDYDGSAFDGTLIMNNSVFSYGSVRKEGYTVQSASGGVHLITVISTNDATWCIWDQITVRGYAASDARVNIGDTIYLNATIEYEYDDTPVIDGTVTISGIFATHQGGGVWQISETEVTVQMNLHQTVMCASNTHGINSVNQNSQSQELIWDRVQVISYSVIDIRVNISDNVDINVTIRYDYDNAAVTDGTVTINGISATHLGGGVWRITDFKATVQLFTYDTVACAGNTYGITVVDQNSQTQDVIWDQVQVQSYSVLDSRVTISVNVDINITLVYAYDSTAVTDGSVSINGLPATHLGSGIWLVTVTTSSVELRTYDTVTCSGNNFGIASVDQNGQSQDVIWDRVQVQSYTVIDARVNINDNVDINVTLLYDYDNTAVTDGTVTINGFSATHIANGIWQITDSESTVMSNTYLTVTASANTHGIDTVDQNGQSQQVIWDQITVRGYSIVDTHVNVSNSVNINVTIEYEYDDTPVVDGIVTINGLSATHQGAGVWSVVDSEASVLLNTYNTVVCAGNAEGITSVNQNSQTVDVIWDRVQVQSYSVSDNRVNLNDNVNIDVTLVYDYDNTAVTDGVVTINGISATHQGTGIWRVTDSKTTVQLFTYDTVACSGNAYGISTVDQNGQSTSVIWDQLVVTIGVDDFTPLNGIQANFTLTIIFDYDDASCTTYQIVIQRNGTWWHSFTDANKSLFVDTNSDTSYIYNVSVVTSESTYNVLTFSTNSQQVVWSAAPNSSPVNDAAPVLINPDDADNMYARYQYYFVTTNVSDANGYLDIDYVELTLYDDSRSTPVWTVRYTVAGGTFSVVLGGAYIDLHATSSATGLGNDLDITWVIKIDWDHSDLTDVDTRQYVHDGTIGVEDYYESNWDIETRLDITGLSVDDGLGTATRGPLDGAISVSGTVIFLGSVDNYPRSNETDVWVSSSEYGISVGPWSDLTLTSGQFSLTVYADDQVGLDTFTIIVVQEATGSGGTDLLSSTTQSTYIADRIQVQSYSSPDPRINIGDTATIDVELAYEYDLTTVTNGSVTVNGISATHQGSGIWRVTDTKVSVQLVTYDSVVYSGGTHGLNQVDQAAMSQDVIWDQIVVQTTVADDTRVNVGTNVEIRVTLWLAYDSTFLGSGDAVTLNGVAMTWDSGNSWFDLAVSQASVGLWTYFVNSSSEATYGITSLDLNSQSVDVVWDQIVVQTTVSDDSRLDVGSNAEIRVTLLLAYDNTFLGAGDSVTLDGTPMTWDAGNLWFDLTVNQPSVGAWSYFVNASTDASYGITSLDLNSQQVQVVWDEIVVQTTVADDIRVNMGANVEIRVTLWLTYDSTFLGAADSVTLDGTTMTWDGANSWFDLTVSQVSVGLWTYFVNSSSDATYGITALNLNSQSVDVIWDRIVVQTTIADDGRVDINANAEIRVTLMLEYDSMFLGAGDSVTLGGTAMTWDGVNSWFNLTVNQATVGAWTYFVNSSLEVSYGINLLDLSGNSVTVIWDRVQVQSYSVSDDRVNIGDTVDIDVSLLYDYDDTPVTDGTITVNGISATHQGAGVWRFSDSEVSVLMNTYNLVAISGNAHGLTVVDQNSQSRDVVWDRLVILIGVDDTSSMNGHQANFTLTVTYDYDDVVCTTYQIVIDRNATWWHSFINGNVSLFVDTNTNVTYLYNASIVSSESTYGITAFTTNTLQVTWSLAPNEIPVNDSSPILANGDDTDFLYARYRYYVITTSASDLDGYADIDYVELTLYSDDQLTSYWTIRYTVGTGMFSVEAGGTVVEVGVMSSAIGGGDTLTITWHIKIGWNHADLLDTDIYQYVDDGTDSDADFYETNWNTETRLIYSITPTLSENRGDVGTSDLVASGSVTYFGSSINPLSNETDVWILHDLAGTWSGDLTAGSFIISSIGSSATVRMNTYTFKVVAEGNGSVGSDLYHTTSLTYTFITDRIEIYQAGVVDGRININSDCEVWWRARYEYDSTEIQSGLTMELNGARTLVWDAGNLYWSWQETSISPTLVSFDIVSATESVYGLTAWNRTTSVQQVIWDSLVITLTDPTDQRIDVSTNATGIIVTAVYAFDSTVFDGSFILNNTNFQYATPQKQGYTVATTTGDSYGITAIGINDVTFCIWDRVLVVSVDADELYHDPDDDALITVELQYEYDGTPVLTGTFAIAGHPLTHVGGGVWEALVTISSYQAVDFDDLTTTNATLYSLSSYNMNSNSIAVYWDRLEFYSVTVIDDRINVGASTDVEWSVRLENAGIDITAGVTAQMSGNIALAASAGVFSATVTETVVGSVTYSILTAILGEISEFVQIAVDAVVVWDQVLVTSVTATVPSLNIGSATEIRVTLEFAFDSSDVTTGQVYLDDDGASVPMSYSGGYWTVSVTKTVAGNYTFTVDSVSGNTHGITSLDTDGLSVEVAWIGPTGFIPDTMTLMIIGGGAGIGLLGLAIATSRRRKGSAVADLSALEPDYFRVTEPVEAEVTVEPESAEPEPEVVGEPEVEPDEVELPPIEEELDEPEVDEAVFESESDVVEEVSTPEEIVPEVDEDIAVETEPEGFVEPETIEEPIEPEVEPEYPDYDTIPEEFIEPEPEVDLSKLTKKELLEMIPDDIRETTSPKELKRLTKQELISLVESFKDIED